jgi:type I restriction enzyme, R subunit
MTDPGRDWNEIHLVEDPAVQLLQVLGYRYIDPQILESERESPRDALLLPRLKSALRKLNPWISDDNVYHAVRAISHVPAASLLEANEAVHTAIAMGGNVEQDRGTGAEARPSAISTSPIQRPTSGSSRGSSASRGARGRSSPTSSSS